MTGSPTCGFAPSLVMADRAIVPGGIDDLSRLALLLSVIAGSFGSDLFTVC